MKNFHDPARRERPPAARSAIGSIWADGEASCVPAKEAFVARYLAAKTCGDADGFRAIVGHPIWQDWASVRAEFAKLTVAGKEGDYRPERMTIRQLVRE